MGPEMPAGYLQVVLTPLGPGGGLSASLSTGVRSDGTFSIGSVTPGHWRLSVPGVYIKSVTRGDREVSAADVEIGNKLATRPDLLSRLWSARILLC